MQGVTVQGAIDNAVFYVNPYRGHQGCSELKIDRLKTISTTLSALLQNYLYLDG
ncbi:MULTISPECIES: hypothetical protein [unclassified Coleofasciculus]|uniref:hypothetical protein n=1 Tax=unclassified Coleofasciculus TaxID=2692782 RepID=UPI0018821F30|nr:MULTISPECIES: hypothetical protein [unclassified Coleofasciculus]MBE9127525.1 hypothetical protein [Coleofasciculus sp. LEGE 07081]MBE9150890.1 hypothetical protein [Coleofasciculus sp. LEGE 07092]